MLPSTPLHSTTTIPHNASLNCCDNPLALNSRAVTPTPPELTSTQQHSPLYPAFSPGRSCSRPACVPPRLEYYVAATEACPAAAKLAATPLQTQNPQICPEKWHLAHLLGGLDTGREENEKTEREDPDTRCCLPSAGLLPERDGKWKLAKEETAAPEEFVGSRRVESSVESRMRGRGSRRRNAGEGGSERRRRPGWRSWDECMHARSGVGVNKCYFLS